LLPFNPEKAIPAKPDSFAMRPVRDHASTFAQYYYALEIAPKRAKQHPTPLQFQRQQDQRQKAMLNIQHLRLFRQAKIL